MFYRTPDGLYRFSELDQFPWLEHGFGTRHSAAPENLATVKQIHSTVVVVAEGRTGVLGQADGILSRDAGILVGIKTADCLPVLLIDPINRAVAAVHAGWRGTAGNIVSIAIAKMRDQFGSSPEHLHAAIGPGIGPCCFEVGEEVATRFSGIRGAILPREPRPHLDLSRVNRAQLTQVGLPDAKIYDSGQCTMCRLDDFYSFRKEKEHAGRMLSFIGIARNT